jgi:3-hydroxyisobutyrate dehydrogenase
MEGLMRIGFIGLGNMGGPMALNLIKKGHAVTVGDIRRQVAEPHLAAGAKWADTPADVARGNELVLTSLPGPKEVEAVALGENGLIYGLARGSIYADLSTSSPTLIRRIHGIFKEKGIQVLDSPVSGGIPGARKGTLAVWVGGDEAVYQKIKPALDAIGDKVSYIGAIGAGEVAKIVHNMIGFCTFQMLAEAFTMGVKAGVSADTLLEVVKNGAYGQGFMLNEGFPKLVLKGNFDRVTFPLRLARKDLGLALDLADEYDVPVPLANQVQQNIIEGIASGLGEKDATVAFTVQEKRAGVKVRSGS